jgi:hypothetical protein
MAPDGNVYFTDWSDKQVCHKTEPEIWDRTNGRVFKIVHNDTKPTKGLDLQRLTDEELVKLVTSDNEWMSRHARRILQERYGNQPTPNAEVVKALEKIVSDDKDTGKRLRAVWALDAVWQDGWPRIGLALGDKDEHIRAFAVLLACEPGLPRYVAEAEVGVDLAASEKSPVVRRALISAGLRFGHTRYLHNHLAKVLPHLVKHETDVTDPVLPHLYWYALEPPAGSGRLARRKRWQCWFRRSQRTTASRHSPCSAGYKKRTRASGRPTPQRGGPRCIRSWRPRAVLT